MEVIVLIELDNTLYDAKSLQVFCKIQNGLATEVELALRAVPCCYDIPRCTPDSFVEFCTKSKELRNKLFNGMLPYCETDKVYGGANPAIFRLLNVLYTFPLKYPEFPKVLEASFIRKYEEFERDHDFPSLDELIHNPELWDILPAMKNTIEKWLSKIDLSVVPCGFGPGVTSQSSKQTYEKYKYFYTDREYYVDGTSIEFTDGPNPKKLKDQEVAVPTAVPKMWDKPRIISPEPIVNGWLQHGLQRLVYELLRSNPDLRDLIDLTDQTRNQKLAKFGSFSQLYCTKDLSAASDSVAYALTLYLFEDTPIWPLMELCRTVQFRTLDENLVSLQKYCGMGSGCCFFVQSLVFGSLMSVITRRSQHLTSRWGFPPWSVFGDDLIILSEYSKELDWYLTLLGFTVNEEKSFEGSFQESCGKMYYSGHDVTPIYFRVKDCAYDVNAENFGSWIALRNNLYSLGFVATVEIVDRIMQRKQYQITQKKRVKKNGKYVTENVKIKIPVIWPVTEDKEDTSSIFYELWKPEQKFRLKDWILEQKCTKVVADKCKQLNESPTAQPIYDWLAYREWTSKRNQDVCSDSATQFKKPGGHLATKWWKV